MTSVVNKPFSRTKTALVSLGLFVFARPALAQNHSDPVTPPAKADALQSQSVPPVPVSAAPDADTKPDAKADATPAMTIGPLERLPPSAFPAPRVRGIKGGSLWLTFHGLQWPYYPKTGIGISGSVWVDTAYQRLTPGEPLSGSVGNPQLPKTTSFLQQDRLVLRATPTWSDGSYFVQGQGEFVASRIDSTDGIIWSADDVWVKAGKWNAYDLQLGRYEAWEVYHFGMGLDLYTFERSGATGGPYTPQIYGLTYAFYRPESVGQGAIHVYPTDWLRFELGTQYGSESIQGGGGGLNTLAVRPVAVVDLGWLKLKGGAEYRDLTGSQDGQKQEYVQRGVGGAVQVIVDPYAEFGVNAAFGHQEQRSQDGTISTAGTYDTFSVGGFANARIVENLLVGAGIDYTYFEDTATQLNVPRNDNFDHWQTFGAVQYRLFDQLFIKAVVAYALADLNPLPMLGSLYKNESVSARLRLMYLF
jgi:hypothetical protein